MKTKVKLSLPAVAVMLFVLSGTGYAMASNSNRPGVTADIVPESRQLTTVSEKPVVSPEVLEKVTLDNSDDVALAKVPSETGAIDNLESENPKRTAIADTLQSDGENTENVALENEAPASATAPTKGSVVSNWLEARATEEAEVRETANGKPSVEPVLLEGGGWCDLCGCWMRHGCDTNGNCDIYHFDVCHSGDLGCQLHPSDYCHSS